MTKEEFIRGLREALAGAPDSIIIENVNYYSQYIDGELGKGRTLEAVMEELGEPQWIAKSILDACTGNTRASESAGGFGGAYDYSRGGAAYGSDGEGNYRSDYENQGPRIHRIDLNKWYVKALFIAIPVLIFLVILSIFGLAFRVAFAILFSPYFWALILIFGLLNWFRRR